MKTLKGLFRLAVFAITATVLLSAWLVFAAWLAVGMAKFIGLL